MSMQVITQQTCFDRTYLHWITNRISKQNNAIYTHSRSLDAVAAETVECSLILKFIISKIEGWGLLGAKNFLFIPSIWVIVENKVRKERKKRS